MAGPSHGALTGIPPDLVYTPDPHYYGPDAFTFTVSDGEYESGPATVSIDIHAVNDLPVASFTYTCGGLTCTFDASGSTDVEGDIAAYAWDLGDGTLDSRAAADHTYAGAGTYVVALTITDSDGATDTATQSVTVIEQSMHIADLSGDRATNKNKWTAIVTVTVHDQDDRPVSGASVNGVWSNGAPGTCADTTDENGHCQVTIEGLTKNVPQISFTVESLTHATLRYEAPDNDDLDGDSDGTTITVYREPPANAAPVASFIYTCEGLNCDFVSTSSDSDGTIVAYGWAFGDGTPASGETASHTYAAVGGYTVILTVTDDGGATAQASQPIAVGDAPTMHIGDLDGASSAERNKWTAVVIVTVGDALESPVLGATVTGSWNTSDTGACTTGADGRCEIAMGGISSKLSNVVFSVEDVTCDGWAYDPSENDDPDADSDGTRIIIDAPDGLRR
jgi:PKD repeat protein